MTKATTNKISIQKKAKVVFAFFLLFCFVFMQISNVYLNTMLSNSNITVANHKKTIPEKKQTAGTENDEEENTPIKTSGVNEDFLMEDHHAFHNLCFINIKKQAPLLKLNIGNNYAMLHAQPPDERNS